MKPFELHLRPNGESQSKVKRPQVPATQFSLTSVLKYDTSSQADYERPPLNQADHSDYEQVDDYIAPLATRGATGSGRAKLRTSPGIKRAAALLVPSAPRSGGED